MTYWYSGPWQWVERLPGYFQWQPPAGCAGLDLRALPLQATAGGTPGQGIFWGASPLADSSYTLLGSGSWRDIKASQKLIDALPTRAGYTPQGDDLGRLILDLLTNASDPLGQDFSKPLIPSIAGRLEVQCEERDSARFNAAHAHWNRVRDVVRHDFRRAFQYSQAGLQDREHYRRVLDAYRLKYKCNWRDLVPADIRGDVPGPLPHATTLTDDFNRANGAIGASWTVQAGSWNIVSNQLEESSGGNARCHYASNLSTDDHYAQIDIVSIGTGTEVIWCGPLCRFDPNYGVSGRSWYNAKLQQSDDKLYYGKSVANTETSLGNTAVTASLPEAYQIRADGSTVTAYQAGVSRLSTTDTAVTGFLRGGLDAVKVGTSNLPTMDNFVAEDVAAPPAGTAPPIRRRSTRFFTGR